MLQNPEELLQKIKQLESELKRVKSCKRYWLVWENKPEIFEEKTKNGYSKFTYSEFYENFLHNVLTLYILNFVKQCVWT